MALRVFYSFSVQHSKFAIAVQDKVERILQANAKVWAYNYKKLQGVERYKNRKWPDHVMESRSANIIILFLSEAWMNSKNCKNEYFNFCEYKKNPRAYANILFDKQCETLWHEFYNQNDCLQETKNIEIDVIENDEYDYDEIEILQKKNWFKDISKALKQGITNAIEEYENKIKGDNAFYLVSTYYTNRDNHFQNQNIRYQSFLLGFLLKHYPRTIIAPSSLGVKRVLRKKDFRYDDQEVKYIRNCKNVIVIHDNTDNDGNTPLLNRYTTDAKENAVVILLKEPENWKDFPIKTNVNYYVIGIELSDSTHSLLKETSEGLGKDTPRGIEKKLTHLRILLDTRYSITEDKTKIFKYLFLNNEDDKNYEISLLKKVYDNMEITNTTESFVMIKYLSHDVITNKEFSSVIEREPKIKESFESLVELNSFKSELRKKLVDSLKVNLTNKYGKSVIDEIDPHLSSSLKEIVLFHNAVKKLE